MDIKRRILAVGCCLAVAIAIATQGPGGADEGHDHPTTTLGSTTTTKAPTTTTTKAPTTTTTAAPAPPPGSSVKKMNYGPYTVPAAPLMPDGKHGHYHSGNLFQFWLAPPCQDCYITGMQANLKFADGRVASYDTNVVLHHMVLFAGGKWDATCGLSFLGFLGERFFAAGAEKTPVVFPAGYGYKINPGELWNMIYELASTSKVQETVNIEMTYYYAPASANLKPVRPVWLDIDQCGDSEYSVPAGASSKTWDWWVNVPGKLLGIGGHLHDGGVNISAVNQNTGQTLCNSVAKYGESAAFIDHHGAPHLSSMSTCIGTATKPVATLQWGQVVRIHSNYNLTAAANDVMGIMIAYITP